MMYDYKVYFREGGSQKEVRRFNMGKKVNFDEFLDRVNEVYPIRDKSYKVIWKDEEDDRITISTNQEFKNLPGLCNIKLEIELETPEEQSSKHLTAKHVNIHCDGCGASGFCGFRYKCLECHDYDLCPKCEAAEVHFEHLMLRIPRPLQKRSKYFKHFYKDAKHFARAFYNDDNNEKDDTSLPRESHHAISSRKRDSQRAHRSCSNFDPWNINVLKEHIRDLVTPFGVDFDFRVVRDNERPTPPAESNVNAADPFADVTTCFTTDKADTEKKSNGVNNNDNKTGSAVNTEYVEVQNDSPAKPDNSEDWTIVEKGSSSSRTSTPPPIVTKSNEHNQKNVTASAPPMNPTKENEEPMPKKIYHSNPKIQKALETLVAMGFSNETGTLAYLLESKNGNLEQVLNIIFSEQSN